MSDEEKMRYEQRIKNLNLIIKDLEYQNKSWQRRFRDLQRSVNNLESDLELERTLRKSYEKDPFFS